MRNCQIWARLYLVGCGMRRNVGPCELITGQMKNDVIALERDKLGEREA